MRRAEKGLLLFTCAWVADDLVEGWIGHDEQLTDGARRTKLASPLAWSLALWLTHAHLADWFNKAGVPQLDPFTRISAVTSYAVRRFR